MVFFRRITLAILLISGGALFLLRGRSLVGPAAIEKPQALARTPIPRWAPLPLKAPALNSSLQARLDVSSDCRRQWSTVLKVDPTRYALFPRKKEAFFSTALKNSEAFLEALSNTPVDDSCRSLSTEPFIGRASRAFLEACGAAKAAADGTAKGAAAKLQPVALLQLCFSQMVRYRNEIVAFQTQSTPLSTLTDKATLEAKLAADAEHGDLRAMTEVGERLVKLNPRDPLVLRQAVKAFFEDWTLAGASDAAHAKALSEKYIDQFERLDPNSPYLAEMRLNYQRLSGDLDQMRTLAADVGAQDPELGSYYLAWASYLQGDRKAAEEILARIVASVPEALTAATTLQLLKNQGPGSSPESEVSPQVFGYNVIASRESMSEIADR